MPLPESFLRKHQERQIRALVLSYRKAPSKPKLIRLMKESKLPEAEPLIEICCEVELRRNDGHREP